MLSVVVDVVVAGSPYSRSGCRANPCVEGVCGHGAECKDVGGRPVCECLPGHQGDPYTGCVQVCVSVCVCVYVCIYMSS